MRYVQWSDGYNKASDKEQYLNELVDKVEKQIELSEKDLDNFKLYGVSDVGAVGAAESRITAARVKLDDAKNQNNTDEKITSLAFANERSRTAQWWLTLASPNGKIIPESILKDRAGWYLSQAQSIETYTLTLLSESGGHPDITTYLSDDIDNAQKEMDRGYYAGAIFDALQGSVKSGTAIGLLGQVDTTKKIEQSASAAEVAINEARMAGIEPTLAVSAYEYAETLNDNYSRISQYSYAKMAAKTSVVLNSHAVSTNLTPIKPELTAFIPEIQPTAPSAAATTPGTRVKAPAFEVVMALAVLLFARRMSRN